MTQEDKKLLLKDKAVTAIKRRIDEINDKAASYSSDSEHDYLYRIKEEVYKDSISIINSLEVKEIDIEDAKKEELAQKYVDYIFKRHNIDVTSKEGMLIYYAYMHGMNQCLTQLRAQKGE